MFQFFLFLFISFYFFLFLFISFYFFSFLKLSTILQSCGLADCVASSYGGRNRKCSEKLALWLLSERMDLESTVSKSLEMKTSYDGSEEMKDFMNNDAHTYVKTLDNDNVNVKDKDNENKDYGSDVIEGKIDFINKVSFSTIKMKLIRFVKIKITFISSLHLLSLLQFNQLIQRSIFVSLIFNSHFFFHFFFSFLSSLFHFYFYFYFYYYFHFEFYLLW